jgi:hypothetical protein
MKRLPKLAPRALLRFQRFDLFEQAGHVHRLVSKSSQPAAIAFSLSPAMALAVSAITLPTGLAIGEHGTC